MKFQKETGFYFIATVFVPFPILKISYQSFKMQYGAKVGLLAKFEIVIYIRIKIEFYRLSRDKLRNKIKICLSVLFAVSRKLNENLFKTKYIINACIKRE